LIEAARGRAMVLIENEMYFRPQWYDIDILKDLNKKGHPFLPGGLSFNKNIII